MQILTRGFLLYFCTKEILQEILNCWKDMVNLRFDRIVLFWFRLRRKGFASKNNFPRKMGSFDLSRKSEQALWVCWQKRYCSHTPFHLNIHLLALVTAMRSLEASLFALVFFFALCLTGECFLLYAFWLTELYCNVCRLERLRSTKQENNVYYNPYNVPNGSDPANSASPPGTIPGFRLKHFNWK